MEFFWKRDNERKKVGHKTEDEVGPFGDVKLQSDDESDEYGNIDCDNQ